jgi:hypothetical protein
MFFYSRFTIHVFLASIVNLPNPLYFHPMIRTAVITLISLCLCLSTVAQSSTKSTAEQEIRAAFCEIDQHAYDRAQQRMERLLQTDPANLNARKVLLGILAAQIKPGDTSPENIALIRKAIDAYQEVLPNPQLTADEKQRIDSFLMFLYGRISRGEQRKELERRAVDPTRTAKDRSSLYTVLAGQSWDCSFKITDLPEVKLMVVKGNNATVIYKKPAAQKDFESAQACVKRGLDEAETALKLDPDNESAWSYKMNLLLEATKLAEMEGDSIHKAAYRKQSDEANKVFSDMAAKRRAEEEKEWGRQEQKQKKADSFTPEEAAAFSRELVEVKRENSLSEAIETLFIPDVELTTLVAPIPIPEEKTEAAASPATRPAPKGCFREVDGPAQVQEKRNWKIFAPAGEEFVVDLPDNVCRGAGGGYIAASEGVMYSINSIPRPAIASTPGMVDGALNTLARTFANLRSGVWLGNGAGNSFELKLVRKENVAGQPRKLYAYAQVSCQVRKESVLLIQAAKTHYYTIDINGANESDPRVQRFLRSLQVK